MIVPVFNVSAKEVDGDNYGDRSWRYYIVVRLEGRIVFDDYYREKPTLKEVIRQTKENIYG